MLDWCSRAERHVESDLAVVLELAPKGNNFTIEVRSGEPYFERLSGTILVLQFNAFDACGSDGRNQDSMFIVDVEIVQGKNIGVTSFVTFHVIDNEVETRELSSTPALLRTYNLLPRLIPIDREFGVIGPASGDLPEDFNPCDIKSGSEIVNCISSNQCKVGAQFSIMQSVVEELFSSLSIHMQRGTMTVRRRTESLLEIRDVLIGPLDLQDGIAERSFPDFAHVGMIENLGAGRRVPRVSWC